MDDWVWTGGGILIFTNGEIKNNRIINNTLNSPTKSALGAGVMCVLEDETVIIKDNYIKNNTSNSNHHSMGSGIGCWGRTTNSKVKIINNVIQNNVSNVNNIYHDIIGGGGIGIVQTHIKNQNCLAVIIKNKIVNNSAPIGGGIILYSEFGARMKLLNNTIVNNESSIKGGGLVLSNARADIINSIFWNNIAPRESDISVRGELDINYSITQTEFTGVGNMIENPMLDLAYDLSSNSSAIDAGYPEFNFNDIEDEQNIGTPLWPAQGNLRNDIGCTGGNYLMDLPDSTYNLPERFLVRKVTWFIGTLIQKIMIVIINIH